MAWKAVIQKVSNNPTPGAGIDVVVLFTDGVTEFPRTLNFGAQQTKSDLESEVKVELERLASFDNVKAGIKAIEGWELVLADDGRVVATKPEPVPAPVVEEPIA